MITKAESYRVKLYEDGILIETVEVAPGTMEYDFQSLLTNSSKDYTVTLQAIGDKHFWRNSNISDASDPYVF